MVSGFIGSSLTRGSRTSSSTPNRSTRTAASAASGPIASTPSSWSRCSSAGTAARKRYGPRFASYTCELSADAQRRGLTSDESKLHADCLLDPVHVTPGQSAHSIFQAALGDRAQLIRHCLVFLGSNRYGRFTRVEATDCCRQRHHLHSVEVPIGGVVANDHAQAVVFGFLRRSRAGTRSTTPHLVSSRNVPEDGIGPFDRLGFTGLLTRHLPISGIEIPFAEVRSHQRFDEPANSVDGRQPGTIRRKCVRQS